MADEGEYQLIKLCYVNRPPVAVQASESAKGPETDDLNVEKIEKQKRNAFNCERSPAIPGQAR